MLKRPFDFLPDSIVQAGAQGGFNYQIQNRYRSINLGFVQKKSPGFHGTSLKLYF